jgi:hypothetical protein
LSGNFREGVLHGKGEEKLRDGTKFKGEFINGKKTGPGSFKWSGGASFKGKLVDGKFYGNGRLINPHEGYEYFGEWKKSKMQGQGILTWYDGRKY